MEANFPTNHHFKSHDNNFMMFKIDITELKINRVLIRWDNSNDQSYPLRTEGPDLLI